MPSDDSLPKPEESNTTDSSQPEQGDKATRRFSGLIGRLSQEHEARKESEEQTDDKGAGATTDEEAERKRKEEEQAKARAAGLAKVRALNKKHFVINNVGGKCLIGEFVPSPIHYGSEILTYTNRADFRMRYMNRKVGDHELGVYWLKHRERRTYEGTDLVAGGAKVLPGNFLNLWRGFGVEPKQGEYPLMRAHMRQVLANGDAKADRYIWNWNAWLAQHPDKQAEAALVLQGPKGVGKGLLFHQLHLMLGATHGLHIASRNQLVGTFNGHLESVVFLFADEAYAADDKSAESMIKAMITEPVLTIEPKNLNAYQVRNRLHVGMAANHEWVVPATGDERRFAVFGTGQAHRNDQPYFKLIHEELDNGGREAMLYDFLDTNLGDWHPRQVYETEALRKQKSLSLKGEQEWFEEILQEGLIPGRDNTQKDTAASRRLINDAKNRVPKLKYMSDRKLADFLREAGCTACKLDGERAWKFPPLAEARAKWQLKFGGWPWREPGRKWWE